MATPTATRTPDAGANPAASDERSVELALTGMTCASCANRIERKLNKLDGVEASVNLATEKAHVRYHDPLGPDDLVAVVQRTGYTADVLTARAPRTPSPSAADPATAPAREATLELLAKELF